MRVGVHILQKGQQAISNKKTSAKRMLVDSQTAAKGSELCLYDCSLLLVSFLGPDVALECCQAVYLVVQVDITVGTMCTNGPWTFD
eukprot:433176-Amphidinium_carterae.1